MGKFLVGGATEEVALCIQGGSIMKRGPGRQTQVHTQISNTVCRDPMTSLKKMETQISMIWRWGWVTE